LDRKEACWGLTYDICAGPAELGGFSLEFGEGECAMARILLAEVFSFGASISDFNSSGTVSYFLS